ncbi:MAG: hypothetical protein CO117_05190, partial [Flavobacteriaceae bacterium CG_4_9_14_3_um_filter_33_16]
KADIFYKTNLDSALFYINDAILLLNSYQDPDLKAKALLHKSKYLLYKKEYSSIFNILKPNLDHAKLINLESLGRTYKDIGHAYKQEWLPDSALVYYIKALKTFERTKNSRDISLTYLAIGLVYSKIGNKAMSKSFYDKSIKFSTNSEIMKLHKDQLINRSEPISENDAIEFLLDILKIAESRNDSRLMAITYSDIKKEYFRLKLYNKALDMAKKELELRALTKFNSTIANTQFFIGNVYALQNKPNKAIETFNKALPNASDSLKLSIYNGLKKAYLETSRLDKAIEVMDKYNLLKESINEKKIKASIAEITSRYQDEKQKQEIETLSFQNQAQNQKISNQRLTLMSTIVLSFLILLLGYFGYKNYQSKQNLNYTQLNFKLLQTQLNPHFIFNALNEIKLNLDTQKSVEASEHLSAYSKLMRLILEGSNEDFVSIEDDVSLISKYLQLQQLNHNNSYEYQIKVDDSIDIHLMQIPTMLTQPFVENAVLHGVKEIKNGRIEVFYSLMDDFIKIDVSDNGKGLDRNNKHSGKELHKSLGTKIIHQRIKNYNKLFNYKIEVKTLSNKSTGTTISIVIPVKIKHV